MNKSLNKYLNKKDSVDGYKFDSLAEAARYCELKLMIRAKVITDLEIHPKFSIDIAGMHVCTVIADFAYNDCTIGPVVEDVKGMDTVVSRLKRKLVEAVHGIKIKVVKTG